MKEYPVQRAAVLKPKPDPDTLVFTGASSPTAPSPWTPPPWCSTTPRRSLRA